MPYKKVDKIEFDFEQKTDPMIDEEPKKKKDTKGKNIVVDRRVVDKNLKKALDEFIEERCKEFLDKMIIR